MFATWRCRAACLEPCLAQANRGDGVIVRLYESLGRATTTSLHTRIPHGHATIVDLVERHQTDADLASIALGPFQIVTLLLEPSDG